jgi:hypothetical protein
LAELEQLAMFNKEPKDITKKVSKMKQRLEAELAAVPDAQLAQLRAKADARIAKNPGWAVGLRPMLLELRSLKPEDRAAAYATVVAEIEKP